jgi:hypothetical protein
MGPSLALVMGCEYVDYADRKMDDRLPGCHADVGNIVTTLLMKYGYLPDNVTVLADDKTLSNTPPTGGNIKKALNDLVKKAEKTKASYVTIFYSGHGLQMADDGNDEADKHDEAIVPVDYRSSGFIRDDYLREHFWTKMPSSVKQITAVFDCCNSGTMFDLPYRYEGGNQVRRIEKTQVTNGPLVVSFSGCKDPQTSASAYNLERRKKWQGAMTFCLLGTLGENKFQDMKVSDIMDQVRRKLKSHGFSQVPQLAFSTDVDVNNVNHLF